MTSFSTYWLSDFFSSQAVTATERATSVNTRRIISSGKRHRMVYCIPPPLTASLPNKTLPPGSSIDQGGGKRRAVICGVEAPRSKLRAPSASQLSVAHSRGKLRHSTAQPRQRRATRAPGRPAIRGGGRLVVKIRIKLNEINMNWLPGPDDERGKIRNMIFSPS